MSHPSPHLVFLRFVWDVVQAAGGQVLVSGGGTVCLNTATRDSEIDHTHTALPTSAQRNRQYRVKTKNKKNKKGWQRLRKDSGPDSLLHMQQPQSDERSDQRKPQWSFTISTAQLLSDAQANFFLINKLYFILKGLKSDCVGVCVCVCLNKPHYLLSN